MSLPMIIASSLLPELAKNAPAMLNGITNYLERRAERKRIERIQNIVGIIGLVSIIAFTIIIVSLIIMDKLLYLVLTILFIISVLVFGIPFLRKKMSTFLE